MSFWEWFSLITGAATLISLAIAVSSVYNGHATRALSRELHAMTQTTLAQMDTGLKQVLDRMDARAEQRYRDLKERLDDEEEV